MDDQNISSQVFDVTQRNKDDDAWHREQERRSFDIIRVINPTDKDFVVEWGKPPTYHRIPANGTADVFRYIAKKFREDIAVYMINDYNQKKHDAEMVERHEKGMQPFESKWHEEQATYQRTDYKRTDDLKEKVKIWNQIWLGVVSEFGKDTPLPQNIPQTSYSPEVAAILNDLDQRKVTDQQAKPILKQEKLTTSSEPTSVSEPISISKEELLAEVSNDNS